jgi:hypothetical protein
VRVYSRLCIAICTILLAIFSVSPLFAQDGNLGSGNGLRIKRAAGNYGSEASSTTEQQYSRMPDNSRGNSFSPVEASHYQHNVISQAAQSKPLVGGIEHRTFAPSGNINPLQGQSEQNLLNGQIDQLRAKIQDRGPLRGGLDDRSSPLSTGVNDRNLRPGSPVMDGLPTFPLDTKQTRLPGDVTDGELNKLRNHDVVIMQDRSSSMGDRESYPQGYFPRWYWCLLQAMDLRRQTMRLPTWTFDLVMFSAKFDLYRGVSMDQLPLVFNRNGIWIGTHLAPPMDQVLGEYFQRRSQGRGKPLIVAVVTDGKPKDMGELCDVIINATRQMRSPNEIHITILQVGTDDESYRKLALLDNGLVRRGARFDIVSVMPFNQATNLGLTRSLLTAVQTAANSR